MNGRRDHAVVADGAQRAAPDGCEQNNESQGREPPRRPRAGAISGPSTNGPPPPSELDAAESADPRLQASEYFQLLRELEDLDRVRKNQQELRRLLEISKERMALARNESGEKSAAPPGGIVFKEIEWKGTKTDSKTKDEAGNVSPRSGSGNRSL